MKTADLRSADVHIDPLQFDCAPSDSRIVRHRPLVSVKLAVFLGLLLKAFIGAGDGRFVRSVAAQPVRTTDWHSDIVSEAI